MIDFNEWVADISSSYRVDIYKKPTKAIGCVPLREGLEYTKQHNIVFTCYDFSSEEEKSVCKELNKLMGVEGLNEKLDFEAIYQDSLHFQEMSRIGNVGNYIISIFSDESPVPHFHFINTKTGDQGCIKILVCEYFKHEKYKAELNSNERKELQTFLTSPTTEEIYREGTTNFKVICHEWNKNNPDKTIDINSTQPNYRDLK